MTTDAVREQVMKIGIIGAGHIGKSLVTKLSAAGHDVKVANSRGPETIGPDILSTGARAVTAHDAVADVDVVILSIPPTGIQRIAGLIKAIPNKTVVIDTSNYYPMRDGTIDAIEAGQVESLWVTEQLGRPIVKAWNAIGSGSLAEKGAPSGTPGRIAIPVAADREEDRRVGMRLVEDTGFDAFDAGSLTESWRQQPGAPGYCTDLTLEEMPGALAAAERARLPKRRDLVVAVVQERVGDGKTNPDAEFGVRVARAICL
ncbi:NADPH-dependent F420 reductase [Methylorubrum extorquens]|uniref:NADPH-dependent F420 reductase n=1 Tax=Methylorubrum extorquens TaxID=408 RepID=UPI0024A7091B|nr:NAD(P)-binding domain-containing protein [Methylorubrum extorquens]